ncbi:unnamed protein product, partial [Tetraodon nigroviridis]
FYLQGFLLLLFNFISTAALEKRFSDFKRCADEECSMLLCRGKAVKDFSGPDCRFLSFKKSETIYVYYKLSGRRTDLWAGTETDFVCFDTGYDQFNNYDVDVLISSSLEGNGDGENKGISDQSQVAKDTQEETQPSADEAAGTEEEETEYRYTPEDLTIDNPSASKPEHILDVETESAFASKVELEPSAVSEETPAEDAQLMQETIMESMPEEVVLENNETKDGATASEEEATAELHVPEIEPVTISEAAQIPKAKTTFGTTFDAVTTDEETTKNVSPHEEEEREFEEKPSEDEADFTLPGEVPLLSLSQEALNTPASDELRQEERPPAAPEESPEKQNLWSSLGDAVFSVVTGGERTAHDLGSDEEEDDDDEEEERERTPLKLARSFEETPEDENLTLELPKEPENRKAVFEETPPSSVPDDETEINSDLGKPSVSSSSVDHSDEEDGGRTGTEEPREETSQPTETSTRVMDLHLQDSSAFLETQKSDFSSAQDQGEWNQEKEVSTDPDVHDKAANLESGNAVKDHSDDDSNNKTDMDQEVGNSEAHQYPFAEEVDMDSPDVTLGQNVVPEFVPDQKHDNLESNESQSELPGEPAQITEELLPEELGDEEEETERLLEDENALSFSHSNSTESEEPSPAAPPPSLSSPEPEYSESVLRLTLLRDHFTQEKMEQIQKLLGLKNLFKLEAMFSDLDTELQATRRTHTGDTQDIENALETILETSENAILDEIERMLDGQETNPNYDQNLDSSDVDEETEILDDFQELAFSLRQKYSTVSDSTPLARDIAQDEYDLHVKDEGHHVDQNDQAAVPEVEVVDNLTITEEEGPAKSKEEQSVLQEVHSTPDIIMEEDSGHFNKNKDNQPRFSTSEEMHEPRQDILERSLDTGIRQGLDVEPEHISSEYSEPVPEIAKDKKLLEAKALNDNMIEEKNKYSQLLEEEKKTSLQNDAKIEKLEKANEKLQLGRKKIQEALAKTTVLLDEAKIREDARQVQHKCLEKEQVALKEENRKFKSTIKDWEDKHKELNNQIKVYQKAQKELEDAVVLKDHNVQTTLTVVEEERDRFMTRLLNEEKARKTLEGQRALLHSTNLPLPNLGFWSPGFSLLQTTSTHFPTEQHQELEHELATLKRERGHVENQLKVLQQKNEIMVEMYQQKENALQQRLTKEELERRSKENMLSEVGGKALEAEEQVKVLRQRISEMEEQMRKTEEVYKEQVNARNAERALNQEKLESSKLREKLAVLTAQLNERRAPLFRPNSGQAAGPRQGDSYGPSPVSGGAPSPPPMIEGPRRPPSAPVGRRTDPFGPRPPSEPLGRYPENKHMDSMGPRSSSPANVDGSAPASFLASPIRHSPGPGPHDQHLFPALPPPGRQPPPGPYRPLRPGAYPLPGPPPPHGPPLPPNGHPGVPVPGGEFAHRPSNGNPFPPRLGPGHVDPRGPLPPPPHFRPSPPLHFGPPPPGVRGPMGPRLPFPPDMRPPGPPMNLPPGVPPHLTHGNIYGQAPPDSLQYPAGAPSSPRQDRHLKQEGPQDSARPATVEP